MFPPLPRRVVVVPLAPVCPCAFAFASGIHASSSTSRRQSGREGPYRRRPDATPVGLVLPWCRGEERRNPTTMIGYLKTRSFFPRRKASARAQDM